MIRILDFTLLVLYCLVIYWISDQPTLPMPKVFSSQDKVLHAGAYFILGILAWRSFGHWFKQASPLVFASVIFCSLYGISDEWHQSFVLGRTPDITDWLADSSGAGLAAFMLYKLRL